MKPEGIQRKRTPGWRMPPGAVYVGRPTKWGNPWSAKGTTIFFAVTPAEAVEYYRRWLDGREPVAELILGFRSHRQWILDHLHELRGKDLACFCELGDPCHRNVLLGMANKG